MPHSLFKPKRRDARTGKRTVGRYWYGQYRLDGEVTYTRFSLRTTDKRVAQQLLDERVEQRERMRAGILAPTAQVEAAKASMAEHLAAFIEYQTARNISKGYTRKIDQRVTRLIGECGWKHLRDVTAESFISWRHGQDLAPKTLNDYQHAIYAVLEWLKKTGRSTLHPIANVGRVDGCGKQSFTRRAFSDEEAQRLLGVSEARRPIYLLALHTGLRLGELRSLRWDDIDSDRPLIRLRAEATKAKRADVLPITPTAQSILHELRPTISHGCLVFPNGVPSHHTFRSDLTAASIERQDERGHKVDFHALRKTFITNLARAGVLQRHAMALGRHTGPRLTANVYTDQDALPLAEAVAKLPTYGLSPDPANAHGRSHDSVSGCPSVSRAVTGAASPSRLETPEIAVCSGVNACQCATPEDTEQKWSRGESNPRAGQSERRFSVRSRRFDLDFTPPGDGL